MNIDYNAISAWAAIIAALTAIVAVWVEGRRTRFSQGLDLLMKLSDQFNSEAFKNKRRTVAKALLEGPGFHPNKHQIELFTEDIIDHFQLVGMLLRKHTLDRELVHSEYFYWLSHYYPCFQSHILSFRQRNNDKVAWEDVDWLYQELTKVERKYQSSSSNLSPTEQEVRIFLQEETNL